MSGNDANGNDVGLDPVQWNYFADPSGSGTAATYYLAITLNGGAIPAGQDQFKVILSNDSSTPIGFAGANAGIGSGTVYGHAADPNAISVGAVDYHNTPAFGVSPPQIEPFSSSGPGQTLINASGQQLASPQSDGKFTLAALDGSSTDLPPMFLMRWTTLTRLPRVASNTSISLVIPFTVSGTEVTRISPGALASTW